MAVQIWHGWWNHGWICIWILVKLSILIHRVFLFQQSKIVNAVFGWIY
jgi:hypothetical protein